MKNRRSLKIFSLMVLVLTFVTIFIYFNKQTKESELNISSLYEGSPKAVHPYNSNNLDIETKVKNEKIITQKKLDDLNEITEKNLYQRLLDKNISVDDEIANRMKNGTMTEKDFEWLQVVIAENMTEEENFKVETSALGSFADIKNAYDKRTLQTGLFYGNDILNNPNSYRDASSKDILDLVQSGATLPKDALMHLIVADNLKLAEELRNSGIQFDVNFVDDYSSMGLLDAQSELIKWNPTKSSLENQVDSFQKLIDLGVPLNKTDGTRDALDRILGAAYATNDHESAERLMALSARLNQIGFSINTSHVQMLESISKKYPDIYQEYIQELQY